MTTPDTHSPADTLPTPRKRRIRSALYACTFKPIWDFYKSGLSAAACIEDHRVIVRAAKKLFQRTDNEVIADHSIEAIWGIDRTDSAATLRKLRLGQIRILLMAAGFLTLLVLQEQWVASGGFATIMICAASLNAWKIHCLKVWAYVPFHVWIAGRS